MVILLKEKNQSNFKIFVQPYFIACHSDLKD